MKKFDQTPYKLPPPTPIHVPAEKRPLEEKSLPKKRVRITPVMRRVSRRSELPMAPVQIPDVLEPVQIPLVPQSPVQIPLVPQSPVQIPVSHVLEPPVQIPLVPQSPVQIPVSQVPQSPVQIPDVPEHVQIPVLKVPQSPVQIPPVQITDVPEPVHIPVSQVPQSPVQIPPVQSLPEPMQILPELDILNPLESTDAFDHLMSFVFGPQELQLLLTVPSVFDGNLFSFLDEFERAPMDLTMPRVNSCVKKSIGFKPIQPMDLSVNSCL
ncbi:hypothetical protein TNCV_827881 [Trichonephila clavipes]|nr:hypothetical protein TNCV_827881 [Trichonephila clavipes]